MAALARATSAELLRICPPHGAGVGERQLSATILGTLCPHRGREHNGEARGRDGKGGREGCSQGGVRILTMGAAQERVRKLRGTDADKLRSGKSCV